MQKQSEASGGSSAIARQQAGRRTEVSGRRLVDKLRPLDEVRPRLRLE